MMHWKVDESYGRKVKRLLRWLCWQANDWNNYAEVISETSSELMQLKYFLVSLSLRNSKKAFGERLSALTFVSCTDSLKFNLMKNFCPTKTFKGSREKRMKFVRIPGNFNLRLEILWDFIKGMTAMINSIEKITRKTVGRLKLAKNRHKQRI